MVRKSIIEIGKAALISLIFNHINWTPFLAEIGSFSLVMSTSEIKIDIADGSMKSNPDENYLETVQGQNCKDTWPMGHARVSIWFHLYNWPVKSPSKNNFNSEEVPKLKSVLESPEFRRYIRISITIIGIMAGFTFSIWPLIHIAKKHYNFCHEGNHMNLTECVMPTSESVDGWYKSSFSISTYFLWTLE